MDTAAIIRLIRATEALCRDCENAAQNSHTLWVSRGSRWRQEWREQEPETWAACNEARKAAREARKIVSEAGGRQLID
jgi:hypothetical protein